jgi:hypothetical protein
MFPAINPANMELNREVVGFKNLKGSMQWLMGFLIAVSIIYVIIVFNYFTQPSSMVGSVSVPARSIFGNANQLLTESGPVHHQDDYERHKAQIENERVPHGVTYPSKGWTQGASAALRVYREGGDNGPQQASY